MDATIYLGLLWLGGALPYVAAVMGVVVLLARGRNCAPPTAFAIGVVYSVAYMLLLGLAILAAPSVGWSAALPALIATALLAIRHARRSGSGKAIVARGRAGSRSVVAVAMVLACWGGFAAYHSARLLGWSPRGNGANKEIHFSLADRLGYSDRPVVVVLRREEFRLNWGSVMQSSGPDSRVVEMNVREAHCEPPSLCRVTILDTPTAESREKQLRLDFTSPGDGQLVVSARSGLGRYTDRWPIATDPVPDGIFHGDIPDILPRSGTVVVDVAPTWHGQRLRGTVEARVIDPPKGGGFHASIRRRTADGRTCSMEAGECAHDPVANFATPQIMEVGTRGWGRAAIELTAGPVKEQVTVKALEYLGGARLEAFACDGDPSHNSSTPSYTECRLIEEDLVRCAVGRPIFVRALVEPEGGASPGVPAQLRPPRLVEPRAVVADLSKPEETRGQKASLYLSGERRVDRVMTAEAWRFYCVEPGRARLTMEDEFTTVHATREVEVVAAMAGTSKPSYPQTLKADEIRAIYGKERTQISGVNYEGGLTIVSEPDGRMYARNILLRGADALNSGRWRVDASSNQVCHVWDRKDEHRWKDGCYGVILEHPQYYAWLLPPRSSGANGKGAFTYMRWPRDHPLIPK